jgi:hypothetical protein
MRAPGGFLVCLTIYDADLHTMCYAASSELLSMAPVDTDDPLSVDSLQGTTARVNTQNCAYSSGTDYLVKA